MGARTLSGHARRNAGVYVIACVWLLAALVFPTTSELGTTSVASGRHGQQGAAGSGAGTSGGHAVDRADGSVAVGGGVGGAGAAGGIGPSAGPGVPRFTADGIPLTRGGVPCTPGTPQVPNSTYSVPCVPYWQGDNGGATWQGVTGDTITIAVRNLDESTASVADSLRSQVGVADAETQEAVAAVFLEYFNRMFELYGRRVEVVEYDSEHGNALQEAQGRGRDGACLDAQEIYDRWKPFAVFSAVTSSPVFSECAAERGMVVFDAGAYTHDAWYEKHHPYFWHTTMDCSRTAAHVSEYIGKRLAGDPARHALDATYQARERTFALYVPDRDDFQQCADEMAADLERRWGVTFTSRYDYAPDGTRLADEAQRGAVQFRAAGATSVILLCDPVSIVFLTEAAANQGYGPEWVLTGVVAQDVDNIARLYDRRVTDGHMFGISQLGPTDAFFGPDSESAKVYRDATGEDIPQGAVGRYTKYMQIFDFLQSAGPGLTPDAMAAGVRTIPELGAPLYPAGRWSWAASLSGPGGDHTGIEDHREVYWDASAQSSGGQPGTFLQTYDGRRFSLGEWPDEPPPVYPS